MDLRVVHDSKNSEFYMKLEDGSKAVLQYEKTDDVLDMHHTEVPPQFQGRGIARRLAETAFNFAVDNDFRILPTCTYIQKFVSENSIPKYLTRIVTKGRY